MAVLCFSQVLILFEWFAPFPSKLSSPFRAPLSYQLQTLSRRLLVFFRRSGRFRMVGSFCSEALNHFKRFYHVFVHPFRSGLLFCAFCVACFFSECCITFRSAGFCISDVSLSDVSLPFEQFDLLCQRLRSFERFALVSDMSSSLLSGLPLFSKALKIFSSGPILFPRPGAGGLLVAGSNLPAIGPHPAYLGHSRPANTCAPLGHPAV